MILNKVKTHFRTILLSAGIVLIGYLFRLLFFDSITFGYDQARDAIQSLSIWQGDIIKIIGPMTDIPGLFHGTLYWYLISPFYFFSKGSVFVVKFFMITLNLGVVFVFFLIAKKITKNSTVAFLASFLYVISFEVNQYARWLSNPSPALLTTLLIYYSYWLMMKKNQNGIYLFLISWALSIHFEFFLIYHIVYFLIFLLFTYKSYYKKVSFIKLGVSLFISLCILSTFIMAEIKFGFQSTKALLGFFSQEKSLTSSFISVFNNFAEKITQSVFYNVISFNYVFAGIVFIAGFFYIYKNYRKQKELLFIGFWICSPVILFLFEKLGVYHVMIGNLFGTILLFSIIVDHYVSKLHNKKLFYVLFVLILVVFQFRTAKYHQKGDVLFSSQDQLLLKDELKVIDWVYNQSNDNLFGINTVTNPLFINTTWGFLFDSYGKNTYGKMPVWLGYPQEGVFGETIKYAITPQLKGLEYYLIIEPPPGIPDYYLKGYPLYESTRSQLIERKEIGRFIVEKRGIILNKCGIN